MPRRRVILDAIQERVDRLLQEKPWLVYIVTVTLSVFWLWVIGKFVYWR